MVTDLIFLKALLRFCGKYLRKTNQGKVLVIEPISVRMVDVSLILLEIFSQTLHNNGKQFPRNRSKRFLRKKRTKSA